MKREFEGEVIDSGPCFFCGKEISADNFCYGCAAYVCDHCETVSNPPSGTHKPESHKRMTERVKV